jgi:uncharacterized protein YraI
MKLFLIGAAALAAIFCLPASAMARPGFTTGTVHMRAGPGTYFPVIDTVPDGADITINGCLADYDWCDVGWAGERGWISAAYLQFVYDGRPVLLPDYAVAAGFPIVTFSLEPYWRHYYRHRHFYRRHAYFARRYLGDRHHHARRAHHARHAAHHHVKHQRVQRARQKAHHARQQVHHARHKVKQARHHLHHAGRALQRHPAAHNAQHKVHRARHAVQHARHRVKHVRHHAQRAQHKAHRAKRHAHR